MSFNRNIKELRQPGDTVTGARNGDVIHKEYVLVFVTHVLFIITLMMSFSVPGFAAQKHYGDSREMLQQHVVAQPELPADSVPGKSPGINGKPSLDGEPSEKQLSIIKMPPPENKSKMPSFTGSWYFKDDLRGEELTIEAFEISKNASGDLVLTPPKRATDSYASVTQFEINDKNLKVQLRWKMKSIVGYWKTETYDLSLSEDGKKLTGSHNQKSMGGRTIEMDRVLFRQ